jgi:hypothetical protein
VTDAREEGRAAALGALHRAPKDPEARLQWAQGAEEIDLLRIAVDEARLAGLTWREIAQALAEVESTVRVRYTQRDRTRRYRERRDAES